MGRIVVAGTLKSGGRLYAAFTRLTSSGGYDPAFSSEGHVRLRLRTRLDGPNTVEHTLGPGGGIAALCAFRYGGNRSCLIRLRPDGSRLRAFSGDGFRWLAFERRGAERTPSRENIDSVIFNRRGRITVAGSVVRFVYRGDFARKDSYSAVARYLKNGKLDTSFRGDGSFVGRFIPGSEGEWVNSMKAQGRRTIIGISGVGSGQSLQEGLLRLSG